MQIEEIRMDDYEEIYRLWSRTPGMGLNESDSAINIAGFLLRNKGFSLCCRDNGRIVGTILCGHDGRRGYIYHTAVDEAYRGHGIGRALVSGSLEKLKAIGIAKCHLFVFADNEPGNAFWNRTGWIKRQDILVYSKNL